MGWTVCNTTEEHRTIVEEDLWDGGITFHHLSLIVGGACALIACIVSIFLIMSHATHYSKPIEQRHLLRRRIWKTRVLIFATIFFASIIRILFMVPVYSIVAWLSILFYNDSVYFEVIGNCYEAFCIAAFFSLMCHYIAPDLHSQKEYFRGIQPKDWLWPLNWFQNWKFCCGHRGAWRTPRSGLTWFNVIWAGVFQYCLIRVLMTVLAVVTQALGRYCEESLSPAFAHVWTIVIEAISVTVAMYCLIQFYVQLKEDISEHSPFLKILSIKLVIFLSFWQSIMISLLVSLGAIGATKKIAMVDLKYGLPELLILIEMSIFSILHLWAFSWKRYVITPGGPEVTDFYGNGKATYQGGRMGFGGLADAMNPLDLLKAVGRSFRWLAVGRKNRLQDPSYKSHTDTIGLQPSGSTLGNQSTAYGGAGAAVPGSRTNRYPSDDEGEILLANAQSNPSTSHLEPSPWEDDSDDYSQGQSGRFSGREGASPYENLEHQSPVYRPYQPAVRPYPNDGHLTEQVPMPIPDTHPPPPYPARDHHP